MMENKKHGQGALGGRADNRSGGQRGRGVPGKKKDQNMPTAGTINIRELALDILLQVMDKGEYCDKALHQTLQKYAFLERRDRAFLTRLTEGTVERCIELDYVIDRYSKTPVAKMKPAIREILRMSVYQILYMDQVPDSAACNEAVKLAVARKLTPLKGFVNGVLRNVARFRDDVVYPSRKKNIVRHFSVWYSMPEWIVSHFLDRYGENRTEKILQSFLNEDRETTVRCNLTQCSREEIVKSLKAQDVTVSDGVFFSYALRLSDYGRLDQLETFEKGWIQVQDESSMLVGHLASVDTQSTVIDVCAAPGGKSLHLADKMKAQGRIFACDISEEKVSLIRQNLIRTGIHNVKLKKSDATVLREEWIETADVVIADLPCSGLGVIGKKCDIKYKTKPQDIQSLAAKQRKILSVVSQYVKPGGTLIFSTCTIAQEENEDNASWIQRQLPFEPVSIEEQLPEVLKGQTGGQGMIQILPDTAGTDGFFVSVFRKKETGKDRTEETDERKNGH